MVTTIQLEERVKHMLEKMKSHPRETYSKIVERLIMTTEKEELSPQTLQNIENALEDVRKGRTYSTAEARKKLKLK